MKIVPLLPFLLGMTAMLCLPKAGLMAQCPITLPGNTPSNVQTSNSIDNLKSLNRQTASTNYLQIIANNLTNTSKAVQLQSSLFVLNPMDSIHKYNDDYYLKNSWQRNLQLLVGGGLDQNSNLNSVTGGLTFNLLDKRDASRVHEFQAKVTQETNPLQNGLSNIEDLVMKNYQAQKYQEIENAILQVLTADTGSNKKKPIKESIAYLPDLPANASQGIMGQNALFAPFFLQLDSILQTNPTKEELKRQIESDSTTLGIIKDAIYFFYFGTPEECALTAYVDSAYSSGQSAALPTDTTLKQNFTTLLSQMDNLVNKDTTLFHSNTLKGSYAYLSGENKKLLEQIARRPLLQLGGNYTYSGTGIHNQIIPSLELFWGFSLSNKKNKPFELDAYVADSAYTDTLAKNYAIGRNVGAVKASIDFTLLTDKSSVSLLEGKLGPEYDHVYQGHYKNEPWDKYYAVFTLLGRPSSKSPWFTITLKYDPKQHNVLGVLNLAFALDNQSNSK
jgi:hypothetical protein